MLHQNIGALSTAIDQERIATQSDETIFSDLESTGLTEEDICHECDITLEEVLAARKLAATSPIDRHNISENTGSQMKDRNGTVYAMPGSSLNASSRIHFSARHLAPNSWSGCTWVASSRASRTDSLGVVLEHWRGDCTLSAIAAFEQHVDLTMTVSLTSGE